MSDSVYHVFNSICQLSGAITCTTLCIKYSYFDSHKPLIVGIKGFHNYNGETITMHNNIRAAFQLQVLRLLQVGNDTFGINTVKNFADNGVNSS